MNFFEELKRRNVIRVALAYGVVAWVLLQFTDIVSEILELPLWAPKFILYALAIGFIPALILAWVFELTPDGIKKEQDVDRSQSIAGSTGRRLDFTIIVLLTIGIVFLLTDRFIGDEQVDEVAQREKSIAVLPFVNRSSDKEQEYFSDGITEELLNALAAVDQLRVAGRTSSFAFRGQSDDLRRVGDALGVAHVLEGSVRKSGDRVRVTAQLVQVDDGFSLWSETYEHQLTDIFKIQDDITEEIVNALTATLLNDGEPLPKSETADPLAYDLYLRAKDRKGDRTQASLEDANRLLDEAIEIDPEYSPAYAQRGIVTILLADNGYGTIPRAIAEDEAKRFIDKALELNPRSAEGLAALGLFYNQRGDRYDDAIRVLEKSRAISPNDLDTNLWLATAYGDSGDESGNLGVLEKIVDIDPLYPPAFGNAVQTLNAFGRPEKARRLIERVRVFDPNDPQLIETEAMQAFFDGDMVEGYRFATRAKSLAPNDYMTNLVFSGALMQTLQYERVAVEGERYLQADALDALGRRAEAFTLARELSGERQVEPLFDLFNRSGRSQDLIDFVEERWPSLADFADDYRAHRFGYGEMLAVALAYSRTGNRQRFQEALTLYEKGIASMQAEGIDNRFFNAHEAAYFAVAGEPEKAISVLEAGAGDAFFGMLPLAIAVPEFESIKDDPRFAAVEKNTLNAVNNAREELGLDPVQPENEFWNYND